MTPSPNTSPDFRARLYRAEAFAYRRLLDVRTSIAPDVRAELERMAKHAERAAAAIDESQLEQPPETSPPATPS